MKIEDSMVNILVVGAHYDDAELGAGGTIAKLTKEGKRVFKITLTDTEVFSKSMNLNITHSEAKENSKNASQLLGCFEIQFPTSKYGELIYKKELMQELEDVISRYKIDTVIFHYSDDYNTDHLAAHKICMTAARHCKNLLMYQSNPYILSEAYYPNIFFDVSDYIELKKKALSCYESSHNRQGVLFETNIKRNELWGYGCHRKYAEGFVAVKITID